MVLGHLILVTLGKIILLSIGTNVGREGIWKNMKLRDSINKYNVLLDAL